MHAVGLKAFCRLFTAIVSFGFQKLFPPYQRRLCRRKAKLLWKAWFRSIPGNSTIRWNASGLEEVEASKSAVSGAIVVDFRCDYALPIHA